MNVRWKKAATAAAEEKISLIVQIVISHFQDVQDWLWRWESKKYFPIIVRAELGSSQPNTRSDEIIELNSNELHTHTTFAPSSLVYHKSKLQLPV